MSQVLNKFPLLMLALLVLSISACEVLTGQVNSLRIIDEKIGSGDVAVRGSRVSVDYTGMIFDPRKSNNEGRHFDTSKGGEPFVFLLGSGRVIKGWDIGIKGMRVGGRRKLIIPPELAYGAIGSGNTIPADTTLIFRVELMDVDGRESGFVILDNKVGSGPPVVHNSKVSVHYTGWLYDVNAAESKGKKFDSSVGKQPFTFLVGRGRVISGWDIGVRGMQVGGHRTLIVPSEMAYGKRGGGGIPPDAKLIFDVELLDLR